MKRNGFGRINFKALFDILSEKAVYAAVIFGADAAWRKIILHSGFSLKYAFIEFLVIDFIMNVYEKYKDSVSYDGYHTIHYAKKKKAKKNKFDVIK